MRVFLLILPEDCFCLGLSGEGACERLMYTTALRNDLCLLIRIKSGEPCFLGFSVPGRLGGVICKPEGVA